MRFLCPTHFGRRSFYPTGRGADKIQNGAFGRAMSKKWPRSPIKCMSFATPEQAVHFVPVGVNYRATPGKHQARESRKGAKEGVH